MRRRIYSSFWALIILLFGILSKIVTIVLDRDVYSVGLTQGSRTLTVATVRGTIYDRHRQPMVNQEKQYYASFVPTHSVLQNIKTALSEDMYQALLEKTQNFVPMSVCVDQEMTSSDNLNVFHIPVRYGSYCPCPQLLGYLDGSGECGLNGIESAYNDVLTSHSGAVSVTYTVNGAGNAIDDAEVVVSNSITNSIGGVALTLDMRIQKQIDEIAAECLDKGAVVVLDAKSGDVLAMGSYPTFHPNELEAALSADNGALTNRALSLYDCGSVFKMVTSIAALENGVPAERCYYCPGEIDIDGTLFHCHNRDGHGSLNMTMAFAKSCNIYYIQLAQEIGAKALLNMIERLGFCEEIQLAKGISSPSSILPSSEDLTAAAALANLSFGQGRLLISPLQVARLTSVMTSNGTLPDVGVVLGLVKNDGEIEHMTERGGETVVSARTVTLMRRMMRAVVTEGTGTAAQCPGVTSAGKTGTAETGQISKNGNQVVQSWFTGYFPAEDPKYVVTILAEDAQNTGNQASKVFCEISNKLTE